MAFLNQNGRAYEMWKRMMQAGEDYIKSSLQTRAPSLSRARPVAAAPSPSSREDAGLTPTERRGKPRLYPECFLPPVSVAMNRLCRHALNILAPPPCPLW